MAAVKKRKIERKSRLSSVLGPGFSLGLCLLMSKGANYHRIIKDGEKSGKVQMKLIAPAQRKYDSKRAREYTTVNVTTFIVVGQCIFVFSLHRITRSYQSHDSRKRL